jgi:DeoR/GlpR family transcriptional regulator of sugar metabolism
MLTEGRKRVILDRLGRDGQVSSAALALDIGVSEDTIRRDLRDLAEQGRLQRVHGGALPASPAVADFAGRAALNPDAKAGIGRAAAAMVRPGQVVLLDGGTTAAQVARHLPRDLIATVVTHSPSTALELVGHTQVEVLLLGGRFFKHSVVAVGVETVDALRRINADLCFLGVTGVHPDAGLTTADAEEAAIKRLMIERAAETWVLASSEKLGAASSFVVAPLAEVSGLIVERDAADTALALFIDADLTVVRA